MNRIEHTDALSLMRSIPDGSVNCILTDPPYGNTVLHFDQNFVMDWGAWFAEAWRILREPNRPVLMFAGGMFQAQMKYEWRKWFRHEWVWVKTMPTGFLKANRQPLNNHEYILVYGQKGLRYTPQMEAGEPYLRNGRVAANHWNAPRNNKTNNQGTRYPTTTLHFSNGNNGSEHPSQKPQELLRYLLKTYTQEGDVVVDPFCGSGSTGVACASLGRGYIMGDVHLPYVETARKRVSSTPYNPKYFEAENMVQPSLLEGLKHD